jgi:hypothetical protein
MGANLALLKGLQTEGEKRMQRQETAVKAISEAQSDSGGPVSL